MKKFNKSRVGFYVLLFLIIALCIFGIFKISSPLNTDSNEDDIAITTSSTLETTTTTTLSVTESSTTTVSDTETTVSDTEVETLKTLATFTTVVNPTNAVENVKKPIENTPTVTEAVKVVETQSEVVVTESVNTTVTLAVTTEPRKYVVYKPSTHYIHRSTCRWADSTCYEITNTSGLECRRCSECSPEMVIETEYVPPKQSIGVTDGDYILLCNAVAHEASSNGISTYNKALVVEVIMNRVNSPSYSNSVYGVLTEPNQFTGAWGYVNLGTYSYQVTDDVKNAVTYYFNNPGEFCHGYFSFWGDGYQNHFS